MLHLVRVQRKDHQFAQDDRFVQGRQRTGDRRQSMGTGKRAPAGSFGARAMAREELQASQICGYCGDIFPYFSRGEGIKEKKCVSI
jgi:hypothetical protein